MNCAKCGMPFIDGDRVEAEVKAIFHRVPHMPDTVHALDITEEMELYHEQC